MANAWNLCAAGLAMFVVLCQAVHDHMVCCEWWSTMFKLYVCHCYELNTAKL